MQAYRSKAYADILNIMIRLHRVQHAGYGAYDSASSDYSGPACQRLDGTVADKRLFPGNGDYDAADGVPDYQISYSQALPCRTWDFYDRAFTCAVAPNFSVMMTARILQACGSGILTSMSQVVLLIIYPLEKRGTIMGWYGLSGAAPVIAPTLAGVIVDLFWMEIHLLYCCGNHRSVISVRAFVFDDVLDVTKKKFDVLSFVISAAFAGITLGIGNIGTYPILDWKVLPLLAVGLLAGYWFVRRQA